VETRCNAAPPDRDVRTGLGGRIDAPINDSERAKRANRMKVAKIRWADTYRDGGSYGFDAEDGRNDEFFMRTKKFAPPSPESHEPPLIYHGRRNGGEIVLRMSWKEAAVFVEPLKFENSRFEELVAIVMHDGLKAE
jgi:hypothetical protein